MRTLLILGLLGIALAAPMASAHIIIEQSVNSTVTAQTYIIFLGSCSNGPHAYVGVGPHSFSHACPPPFGANVIHLP